MKTHESLRGFTLIEVMIVVAVVAILAAVAYPSYVEHVRKGQIAEATSILAETRIKMEQHFQDNNTYASACDPPNFDVAWAPTNTGQFQFSCTEATDAAFTLTATSIDNAYVFTIDENNTRQTTTFAGTDQTANCWMFKKGATC